MKVRSQFTAIWLLCILAGCSVNEPTLQPAITTSPDGIWSGSVSFDFETDRLPIDRKNFTIRSRHLDSIQIQGLYRYIDKSSTLLTPSYPVVDGYSNGTTIVIPPQELPSDRYTYSQIVISGEGVIDQDSMQLTLTIVKTPQDMSPIKTTISFGAIRICTDFNCKSYIRNELLGYHHFQGIRKEGRFIMSGPGYWVWTTHEIVYDCTVNDTLLPFEIQVTDDVNPPLYATIESVDKLRIFSQNPYSGSSVNYIGRLEYLEGKIYLYRGYSYRWSQYYDSLVSD